jgi:hypothetical protein
MTDAEFTKLIQEKKQAIIDLTKLLQNPQHIWYLFGTAEVLLEMEKEKKN